MNKAIVSVIIVARNEEKTLPKVLRRLREQRTNNVDVKIIVIDDGSSDATPKIAELFSDIVVRKTPHKLDKAGLPIFAQLYNEGLKISYEIGSDYFSILDADTLVPNNYFDVIVKRMKLDNAVIASGATISERSFIPRNTGRVIDSQWFLNVIGGKYPIKWGYEDYPIYKAICEGYKVCIYDDLPLYLLRPTKMTLNRCYYRGKGMKALNYWTPYALLRIVWVGLKHGISCLVSMAKGYMEVTEKFDDLSQCVPLLQKRMFLHSIKFRAESIR